MKSGKAKSDKNTFTFWELSKEVTMYAVLIFLLLNSQMALSEGFKLVNIGSHKEPVTDEYITLPNTSIKAGVYQYLTNSDDRWVLGFLIDSKKFFYVDSEHYTLTDNHFGLKDNYFVVDGWCCGSTTGSSRIMFLVQFDKNSVKLLDVINEGFLPDKRGIDFQSEVDVSRDPMKIFGKPYPYLMKIENDSFDGAPEFKIGVVGHDFTLYIEIIDRHLRINFNPDLYAPLFVREAKRVSSFKHKSDKYFFYGFLSKKLDMQEIRRELSHNPSENDIASILGNINYWDLALHDLHGVPFVMKQFDIERK